MGSKNNVLIQRENKIIILVNEINVHFIFILNLFHCIIFVF